MTISGDTPASLFGDDFGVSPSLRAALAGAAEAGIEERGAVFTKSEVVDFILDIGGYTPDKPLYAMRLLEPSAGAGDFLVPAVRRLLQAFTRARGAARGGLATLQSAVRAVEVHRVTFGKLYDQLRDLLAEEGLAKGDQTALLDAWLIRGDFLLEPLDGEFDVVVGNPPYVRQELISDVLLDEYRRRFSTVYDRADIYVPFIERSLRLLKPGGALTFICADRWMKNRYGGPLRRLVAREYHLKLYVDMVDTPAFHSDVIAYPAIFSISRERRDVTRVAHKPSIDAKSLRILSDALLGKKPPGAGVQELAGVARGDAPWVLQASEAVRLVRRLEKAYPTLEDAHCHVGIGVATGADKVFIAPFEHLDVEPDRKLRLVMTRDIADGTVRWRGYGVVNPFTEDGGLVRLDDYPKLAAYLEAHGSAIKARHVARRNPGAWYRTIDRITPSLAATPKLLIPDIKGEAHVVYEGGTFYPHHNLYYVTSARWELRALQAVLLSEISRLFISTYSTKMRGGFLRFQAQYLRRIRLPHWEAVPTAVRRALAAAAEAADLDACNTAVAAAYDLSDAERATLGGRAR